MGGREGGSDRPSAGRVPGFPLHTFAPRNTPRGARTACASKLSLSGSRPEWMRVHTARLNPATPSPSPHPPPSLSLSPSSSSPLRVEASPWALVPPLPRPAAYSNLSLRLRSRLRSLWAIQVLDPAPEFRPRPSFGVSGGYGGGNRPTGPGLVSESGQEVSAEPGVQGRPWDPGVHRPSPPVGAALSSLVRVLGFPGRA